MRQFTGHHTLLSVCNECSTVVAGDTTSFDLWYDTPEKAAARIEIIQKSINFLSDLYGDAYNNGTTNCFSNAPCECCESHKAGERYEVLFIQLEIDEDSSEEESSEEESSEDDSEYESETVEL